MEPKSNVSKYIKNNSSLLKRVSDPTHGLHLFHYPSGINPVSTIEKHMRGVIVDDEYNVVMPGILYTEDIVYRDDSSLPFLNDGSENTYFTSLEGTIIRVYNFKGKWFVSTTKTIDAYQSRWGGYDTFGTLFENAIKSTLGIEIETFFNHLTADKQYVFLMRNTKQTRIVSAVTTGPSVFVVGVFSGDDFELVDSVPVGSSSIQSVPRLPSYPGANAIMGYDLQCQGLFVVSKRDGKFVFYKVLTPHYYDFSKLRGSSFDIRQRYLEMRSDPRFGMFMYLFADTYSYEFLDLERRISSLAQYLLTKYNDRFYYGRYARVYRYMYRFFMGLQSYQKKDSLLTYEDMHQYFRDVPAYVLFRMVMMA